jgi:hypothetical protein
MPPWRPNRSRSKLPSNEKQMSDLLLMFMTIDEDALAVTRVHMLAKFSSTNWLPNPALLDD